MNPTTRFSSRVENYVKFRPGYPPQIIDLLKDDCGLSKESIIADIGSGTGILAELFLKSGNSVFGVEPNQAMRLAGERLLSAYDRFVSVGASAENTGLDAQSIDFITAGQAFHWFNLPKARQEFQRILRPAGWVVLIWNERRLDSTPFLRDYEDLLLSFGTDYQDVRHENIIDSIRKFFSPSQPKLQKFDNVQMFDYEGLKGRLLSASYTPEPEHPNFEPMLARLAEIFARHEKGGKVAFEYDTTVYFSHLE
jgi:SAM-dependent methyltransferase